MARMDRNTPHRGRSEVLVRVGPLGRGWTVPHRSGIVLWPVTDSACPSKALGRPLAGFSPWRVRHSGEGRLARPESPLRVLFRLPRLRSGPSKVFRDNSAGGSCSGERAALAGNVGVEQGEEIGLEAGADGDTLPGGWRSAPLALVCF